MVAWENWEEERDWDNYQESLLETSCHFLSIRFFDMGFLYYNIIGFVTPIEFLIDSVAC